MPGLIIIPFDVEIFIIITVTAIVINSSTFVDSIIFYY